MPPRIDPTKIVKHEHHLDEHWPGQIWSTWTFLKRLKIRRERRYAEPANQNLRSEAWQIHFQFGDKQRSGFRWEGPRRLQDYVFFLR